MRTVLSSALSRAMWEELISRNVAHLVELPGWERQPITPWSAAEARALGQRWKCLASSAARACGARVKGTD